MPPTPDLLRVLRRDPRGQLRAGREYPARRRIHRGSSKKLGRDPAEIGARLLGARHRCLSPEHPSAPASGRQDHRLLEWTDDLVAGPRRRGARGAQVCPGRRAGRGVHSRIAVRRWSPDALPPGRTRRREGVSRRLCVPDAGVDRPVRGLLRSALAPPRQAPGGADDRSVRGRGRGRLLHDRQGHRTTPHADMPAYDGALPSGNSIARWSCSSSARS